MNKKINIPLMVLVILLMALSITNPFGLHPLSVGSGNPYLWHFSGSTNKEFVEGPAYTVDETHFPVATKVSGFVDESKYVAIMHVSKELRDRFAEKGYNVIMKRVDPKVVFEQRRKSEQFRDYTRTTVYIKLVIDCDATFETDKPLTESPMPDWVLPLLAKIVEELPSKIIGLWMELPIYEHLKEWVADSFVVTENEVDVDRGDEGDGVDGDGVNGEENGDEDSEGFAWSTFTPIIIIVVVAIVLIVFVGARRH